MTDYEIAIREIKVTLKKMQEDVEKLKRLNEQKKKS